MIKTTLLTGFLGAGKTTYINALLKENPNCRYAIIENELGAENIDGKSIFTSSKSIFEIMQGCLCCTQSEELIKILSELALRKDEFDELIIEATGIADPNGIISSFKNHPSIQKEFELYSTICLIDSEQIENQINEIEVIINQIVCCENIILNKTDLISIEKRDHLKETLEKINPLAKIYFKENNKYPKIDSNNTYDFSVPKEKVFYLIKTPSGKTLFKNNSLHNDNPQTYLEITSHTFAFDEPIDLTNLGIVFNSYLWFQSKNLYRMKAIVYIEDSSEKYLIQSVGKRLNIEVLSEWETNEEKSSKFVFIGKDLQEEGLLKLVSKCLVSS
jgi:G3E family GTPase